MKLAKLKFCCKKMATNLSIPARNYRIGNHKFTLNNLPTNTKGFSASFTRTSEIKAYPLTTVIARIAINCSKDNGLTWHEFFTGGFFGGPQLAKDGISEASESLFIVTWPWKPVNDQRVYVVGTDVEISVELLADIRTAITIQSIT